MSSTHRAASLASLLFLVGACGAITFACAAQREIAATIDPPEGGPGIVPTDPDANVSIPETMCATTECPYPYMDCPGSAVRCGTNLRDDIDNCGACGRKCPDDPVLRALMESGKAPTMDLQWDCLHGECVSRCLYNLANCNGHLEDGCEVDVTCDPENCGGCGNKCAPGQACVFGTCGCPAGLTRCGDGQCKDAQCVNLKDDQFNCGECGIVCSRPWDVEFKPNTDWGCLQGKCDVICKSPWAECNGDVDDGCETNLNTNENCGACGHACAAGEMCSEKHCVCDPLQTNCCEDGQVLCNGECVSLNSNPDHCGGCGQKCPAVELDGGGNTRVTCVKGVCGFACDPGYGDCNQSTSDGCETWLRFDPKHCGACGNACNPDQPCVEGRCATAPCDGGTVPH